MHDSRSSNALGEFLRARREAVQPEHVGLVRLPGRRVPGLRREEVAELAGISPDYYLRIEQGRDRRPSEQVLLALSTALQLDDNARQYLFRRARPQPFLRPVHDSPRPVAPSVLHLLDQWSHTPAFVTDALQTVLAANFLAGCIAPPGMLTPGSNMLAAGFASYAAARPTLDPADPDDDLALRRWEEKLRIMVAPLRYYADPDDRAVHELVGSLSADPLFRTIWAEHVAEPLGSGTDRMRVEPIGWIELEWQTLEIPRSEGQFLSIYFAEPGSAAAAALAYLRAGRGDQPDWRSVSDLSTARASSLAAVKTSTASSSAPGRVSRV